MNIKDFKVGQTVYVELTGDACRKKMPEECIEEWEITFVGKKYIKAAEKTSERFRREIAFEYSEGRKRFVEKTKYSPNYMMYATRQEIEDKREKSRLYREIEEVFCGYNHKKLTLEQLRRIKGILDEESGGAT